MAAAASSTTRLWMRLSATGDASAISPSMSLEATLVGQMEDCRPPLTQVKGASRRVRQQFSNRDDGRNLYLPPA
jgi:hypothetical protein